MTISELESLYNSLSRRVQELELQFAQMADRKLIHSTYASLHDTIEELLATINTQDNRISQLESDMERVNP